MTISGAFVRTTFTRPCPEFEPASSRKWSKHFTTALGVLSTRTVSTESLPWDSRERAEPIPSRCASLHRLWSQFHNRLAQNWTSVRRKISLHLPLIRLRLAPCSQPMGSTHSCLIEFSSFTLSDASRRVSEFKCWGLVYCQLIPELSVILFFLSLIACTITIALLQSSTITLKISTHSQTSTPLSNIQIFIHHSNYFHFSTGYVCQLCSINSSTLYKTHFW